MKIGYRISPPLIKKRIWFARRKLPIFASPFWDYYKEAERSQWLSSEALLSFQFKKLKHLLEYAYIKVPYYRKIFDALGRTPQDIRTLQDFKSLPILTREKLINNFEDLKSIDFASFNSVLMKTSGSTGAAKGFYISEDRIYTTAAYGALHREWLGWNPGERVAQIVPQSSPDYFNFTKKDLDKNSLSVISIDEEKINIDRDELKSCIRRIIEFRPRIIVKMFPSLAFLLAKYIKQESIDINFIKAIQTCGEILFASQRRAIERAFKCRVFDRWGNEETIGLAHECPHGSFHIHPEHSLIELVNSNQEEVDCGKMGFVVGTQFDNFVMPLIRFKIGDVATLSSRKCKCKRSLPALRSVAGHFNEIINYGGRYIEHFDVEFANIPGIHFCQIIQKEYNSFLLRIIKDDGYSDNSLRQLFRNMHKLLDEKIVIDIEFVHNLARINGKLKLVISELPLKL